MSDLDEHFLQAKTAELALTRRPDNDTLLPLYALYKQGSEGDANGEKPDFFDFVGTAKCQAWEALKDLASDDAARRYIDQVNALSR